MLLVKTVTRESDIAGTGLFAAEFIPKGTLIWKYSPHVDEAYHEEEIEQLPEPKRSEILSLFHSFRSRQTGRYVLCCDDGKYMNHSFEPNTLSVVVDGSEEPADIAARDIQEGEEITMDYRVFDEEILFHEPRLQEA